ncbi:MAG: nicotinate phosphoribosyltransferase [Patescibacteria group bacterium]
MLKLINKISYADEEINAIIAGKMPIIQGLSDNDLYKFSMQQAVLLGMTPDGSCKFTDLDTEYSFTDRRGTKYPKDFAKAVRRQIELMAELSLTPWELDGFKKMPWFKRNYLDFLLGYRYDPREVTVAQKGNKLKITIRGPWYRTILWEVPLLAIVSELYFHLTGQKADENIFERNLKRKTQVFNDLNVPLTDFGTRRRFSYRVQEATVLYLKDNCTCFAGTSNVYLAFKYGLRAIGTHAHEWFMAHQAMFGTRLANKTALESWVRIYDGSLGTALTDTFTSDSFFEAFGNRLARLFDSVRHDSGDPIVFGEKAINHYLMHLIDPLSKTIIFSDGLDDKSCVKIANHFKGRTKLAWGIGTFLSNDVGVKPLQIVIKLSRCRLLGSNRWIDVVKLSDNPDKHSGRKKAIAHAKYELGIK